MRKYDGEISTMIFLEDNILWIANYEAFFNCMQNLNKFILCIAKVDDDTFLNVPKLAELHRTGQLDNQVSGENSAVVPLPSWKRRLLTKVLSLTSDSCK